MIGRWRACTTGARGNWRAKIEDTRKELHDTRNGLLANAGVEPKAMEHSEAKPAAPAKVAKSVKMPDGKVLNFDEAGNQL